MAAMFNSLKGIGEAGGTASFGKGRSISGTTILVIVICIGLVFFGGKIFKLWNDILAQMGLAKDKDDKTVEAEQKSSVPGTPFNIYTWQKYGGKYNGAPMWYATADEMIKKIWNATGVFDDDEETIIGVFKSLRSQAECSFLCYRWQQNKGSDLLEWLPGGPATSWPKDRLSNEDVARVINFVNKLPKTV